MELGEKLKQARLEAGLSQRQLCGDQITRNMLSQIENGNARPSMDTLSYLAARLGKSVGFFLGEAAASVNQGVMESARRLFDQREYGKAVLVLEAYQAPDPAFDREAAILRACALQEQASQALTQGRIPYARELLEEAAIPTAYCGAALERRRLLLLGRIPGEKVAGRLPSLDEELMLRAREAMASGNRQRAQRLLEAAEDWERPQWRLLRGELHFLAGQYQEAAQCFRIAESVYPKVAAQRLETCYRELEDYKQAYFYACKNRGL